MPTIDVTARSSAPAERVYALLADGATWPAWSPLGSFRLERPGADAAEGVGAIRVFRTGRFTSREEIVELVEGRRLGYALLSGLPLRGYRANVDLTPGPDGTVIRWRSVFTAKVPGTGWLFAWALGTFIRRCADGLARHAAQARTAG
ncbi:MAG TPA: SRPBCC family protein [Micromonosporaceae bacterium]|nr:SRPBCC family protein [Micromonosporaceae bacterium]